MQTQQQEVESNFQARLTQVPLLVSFPGRHHLVLPEPEGQRLTGVSLAILFLTRCNSVIVDSVTEKKLLLKEGSEFFPRLFGAVS